MNGDEWVTRGSNVDVKRITEKENGKRIARSNNIREKLYFEQSTSTIRAGRPLSPQV